MAGKCCEHCVGLSEKLEKVMKEVEELKRIITAQGVQGLNTDDAESSDYDSEKDEIFPEYNPSMYKFRPNPDHVPVPLQPCPKLSAPFTFSPPGRSPDSPPLYNISYEPRPKRPRFALSPSRAQVLDAKTCASKCEAD